MKRSVLLILVSLLVMSLLTGCAGTTVVINECTCPGNEAATEPVATEPVAEGELKTGLAVFTSVSDSISATADAEGAVKYDLTIAAVTLDANGVIQACAIDSVPATVKFDTTGAITSDLTAPIQTKGELGENYGMKAAGAVAEWDEQIAALCDFAVGKTVEEMKSGAVDETGKAPADSDLASSATIYLGGYVSALEAAAANATALGAQAGDELKLVTISSLGSCAPASAEEAGLAQLDTDIAVVTVSEGVVTSCIIDAVQAKVNFDTTGTITTDLTAPIQTKNELGENYGMVAWGQASAEWNEQAASFASYITGKTAEEIAGIAVNEATKPADGTDLASSVTISVGGFQNLIAKALS